jgi:hypothetical protein
MKNMNRKNIVIVLLTALSVLSCDYLEPDSLSLKYEEDVYQNLGYIDQVLTSAYTHLPAGYNDIDGSWIASASDESEEVETAKKIQSFNIGNWNAFSNSDDVWANSYKGIRKTCDFLEGTDTITWIAYKGNNEIEYNRRLNLLKRTRGEAKFLQAFYYFELVKRYGGVPLVKKKLELDKDGAFIANPTRESFENCIKHIVTLCDSVIANPQIPVVWSATEDGYAGRASGGAAMALKSRTLLYAASDLYNQPGVSPELGYTDVSDATRKIRWENAAKAAYAVIATGKYTMQPYNAVFVLGSGRGSEVIFEQRYGSDNVFDKANYPIGFEKGTTGTCPSQNLVDAYEMKADGSAFDWNNPAHAANPYIGRDPRLQMTILTNNELYGLPARKVEIWQGGLDGLPRMKATKTGYYLKKWVNPALDFSINNTAFHQWVYFRLAEFYLNYAEAMNEAFKDPTYKNTSIGYMRSAIEAANIVRSRFGVSMPGIPASTSSADFTKRLRNERRIELAFEGHRWFDARRWMIGATTLGADLRGVNIVKVADNSFTYTPFVVEKRVYDSKMNLYPIPQSEINKSGNSISQNPNW